MMGSYLETIAINRKLRTPIVHIAFSQSYRGKSQSRQRYELVSSRKQTKIILWTFYVSSGRWRAQVVVFNRYSNTDRHTKSDTEFRCIFHRLTCGENRKRNYRICWRSTRNEHIARRQVIVLCTLFFLDQFLPATFFVRFQFLPKWIRRTIYNKPNKPDNFPDASCGLVRRGQNPFWRDKHVRRVFISSADAFSFFFSPPSYRTV